jgi:hypothetical protein
MSEYIEREFQRGISSFYSELCHVYSVVLKQNNGYPNFLGFFMLGKMPHKENSQENSHPRAVFNGRYEVVQEEERTKGKGFRPGMAFYRRGRVRGWRIRRGS